MHQGPAITTGMLVKWALSAIVALLMLASWIAWLAGTDEAWEMLALTGCATSAAAAVAHVRCYAVNICRMVRMNAEALAVLEPGNPRPLR